MTAHHAWNAQVRGQFRLMLLRAQVIERGVKTRAVVDDLDERIDACTGFVDITIGAAIDFLFLQRPHEALGLGVVMGVAGLAHARRDVMGLHLGDIVAAGILHPAIVVMDQAPRHRPPGSQRHVEHLNRQLGVRMRRQRQPITYRLNASRMTAR